MARNQRRENEIKLTEISGAQRDVDRAIIRLGNLNRAALRIQALSRGGQGGFADLENLQEADYMHYELARDDVGWTRLGVGDTRGLTGRNRVDAVQRSRVFAIYDALCKQAVELYTNYSIGDGIQWNVRDEEKGQPLLNEIIHSVANRHKFDAQGLRKTSTKLLVDGEVFWAIFLGNPVGETKLRQIDSLQIVDIATDPEDEETPRFYKRAWRRGGTNKIAWYRDYMNLNSQAGEDSEGKIIHGPTDTALIYHTTLDGMGMRGEPLLTASLDEAEANRQFLRARLSVVLSIAQFAWILKMKGGQAAVDAVVNRYNSTLGTGNETHPPAASGSTAVENEGMTRTPVNQETGAASAQIDGGMFLQRYGSGVGIFPHYFGAGDAFRLATATAMELPMFKTFMAYRRLQWDMYLGLFDFLFELAGIEDRYIDPEQPPIVPKDVAKLIHAVAEIGTTMPHVTSAPEVEKLVLTYLGIDNVDEVWQQIQGRREEPATEAEMTEMIRSVARNLKRVAELQVELQEAKA